MLPRLCHDYLYRSIVIKWLMIMLSLWLSIYPTPCLAELWVTKLHHSQLLLVTFYENREKLSSIFLANSAYLIILYFSLFMILKMKPTFQIPLSVIFLFYFTIQLTTLTTVQILMLRNILQKRWMKNHSEFFEQGERM